MPGFFDRINETNSNVSMLNNSSNVEPSDLDIFSLKPIDFEKKKLEGKKILEEKCEFGSYQKYQSSMLDPPLIENVMNAMQFVNSGNNMNSNDKLGVRRQKYMPVQKSAVELFEEAYQIHEGPVFNKVFGLENDCEISVTGGDGKCPIISTFDECNFSKEIMKNIFLKKYRSPTQIQKCIIPLISYQNFDIMGHAQTGSGKTAAFILPIIHKIQMHKEQINELSNPDSPYAIVLAPTKELAEQLGNDARSFAERTNVHISVSYGDMPLRENLKQIRYGCDIFVVTCGRLIHFVNDEIIKLKKLKFFILDEADKLLNDSFFEVVKAIKEHKNINSSHRTLLFSATFDEQIHHLANDILKPNFYFVRIGEMNRPAETIEQKFIEVQRYDKQDLLVEILMKNAKEKRRDDNTTFYEVEKTIIFVQHKRQSDRLAIALAQLGFLVISINADRTLKQRFEAAENFTKGLYNILVATDVASRGLNFPNVSHIINFDLPENDSSSYIHRIGRSGRAGNLGRATSFFDPNGEERRHIVYYIQKLQANNLPVPKFMDEIFKSQQANYDEVCRTYTLKSGGSELNGEEWF